MSIIIENVICSQGASFGYHAGGWGKPPVDEQGKPLYGDVFGIQQQEAPVMEEDEQIENQPWGELESESEEESESEVMKDCHVGLCHVRLCHVGLCHTELSRRTVT